MEECRIKSINIIVWSFVSLLLVSKLKHRINETRSLSANECRSMRELSGMSYLTQKTLSYSPASIRDSVNDILPNEAPNRNFSIENI